MCALFFDLVRNVLSLSSSPKTFKQRMISSRVVLAPHVKFSRALPVVRIATHKLLVSVIDVVGLELLSITLANKHMSTAQYEKPLKKWQLEFASPSGDYSTFLCLSLSFLIVNPLILQNTFWSYKILVSFSTIF